MNVPLSEVPRCPEVPNETGPAGGRRYAASELVEVDELRRVWTGSGGGAHEANLPTFELAEARRNA